MTKTRTLKPVLLAGAVLLFLTGALVLVWQTTLPASTTAASSNAQPYAGLETRAIKAVSPERVANLLAGKGASYALAAELNHFPGPRHVLELAPQLELGPEQERAAQAADAAMEQDARELGRRIVELETELDRAFASRSATPGEVERLTAEIGALEAKLRAVHLRPHLEMGQVLTPDQIARYNHLRGYGGAGEQREHTPGKHGG